MFVNLCVDVLEAKGTGNDAVRSEVGSPQSAPLRSVQGCGFISDLSRICQVWLLLPDLTWRSGDAAVAGSQRNGLKDQAP